MIINRLVHNIRIRILNYIWFSIFPTFDLLSGVPTSLQSAPLEPGRQSSLQKKRCGEFHKWGYPEMDGLSGKILLKWMIWRYSYLWNPPRLHQATSFCQNWDGAPYNDPWTGRFESPAFGKTIPWPFIDEDCAEKCGDWMKTYEKCQCWFILHPQTAAIGPWGRFFHFESFDLAVQSQWWTCVCFRVFLGTSTRHVHFAVTYMCIIWRQKTLQN